MRYFLGVRSTVAFLCPLCPPIARQVVYRFDWRICSAQARPFRAEIAVWVFGAGFGCVGLKYGRDCRCWLTQYGYGGNGG